MPELLTKSRYLQFLTCPREFWLAHHKPELFQMEETLQHDHLRKQGYAVQKLARELSVFHPAPRKQIEFERVFQTDTLYAKADAVITDLETGEISIFEIKSSASVKPEHIEDLAFQKTAAEAAGARVAVVYLIIVNNTYVRNGRIDAEQLCAVHDVTAQVLERQPETFQLIQSAFDYLASPAPEAAIIGYCGSKLDCTFIRHHFPELPDYTVFEIGNLKKEKRDALLNAGIVDITQVPDDFALSDRQRRQVAAARSGEPFIDAEAIKSALDAVLYPLHFLDYESFSYAVPQYSGIRPYQQMVFQYSLHTVAGPGSPVEHKYFLSDGTGDPPLELARSLRNACSGGIGKVVVWSQGFEKTVNKQIGEMYPEFAAFFAEVNEKTFDLRKIFSDHYYLHPAFRGSTSIKKVIPVLAPHLSYENLAVGDGMTASITWFNMATGRMEEVERRQTYEDLCKYCHMDTWAMVEIYEFLKAI
jgi:CRISPR/Cas system-associated exonuclease Cas4 (RecB family)